MYFAPSHAASAAASPPPTPKMSDDHSVQGDLISGRGVPARASARYCSKAKSNARSRTFGANSFRSRTSRKMGSVSVCRSRFSEATLTSAKVGSALIASSIRWQSSDFPCPPTPWKVRIWQAQSGGRLRSASMTTANSLSRLTNRRSQSWRFIWGKKLGSGMVAMFPRRFVCQRL
jgi:hypothetical protein